jgi:hypothetical protein
MGSGITGSPYADSTRGCGSALCPLAKNGMRLMVFAQCPALAGHRLKFNLSDATWRKARGKE